MRSAAAVFIVLPDEEERRNGRQTLSLGCSRPESRKQQISSSKSEHILCRLIKKTCSELEYKIKWILVI
jgi:hypothetical protein